MAFECLALECSALDGMALDCMAPLSHGSFPLHDRRYLAWPTSAASDDRLCNRCVMLRHLG